MEEQTQKMVYEIGFHLAPTLSEDKVAPALGSIKEAIEKEGGVCISEEFPKMMPLAYVIRKHTAGGYQKYNSAYFGWVKYEAPAESSKVLNAFMKENGDVIRFLLIKTVRENTMPTKVFNTKADADGEEVKEITQEDEKKISAEIEDLVIE